MGDLTKTRTILTHSHSVDRGPVFDAADEDGGRLTVLTLDERAWDDMGSPEQITVTIEPGDLLNVDDPDEIDARAVLESDPFADHRVVVDE